MRPLTELLQLVPVIYRDMEDAALPVRTGVPSDRPGDPREKPAPGRLDVMEHRHQLLRGLRWWVDAVYDSDSGPLPPLDHPHHMAHWLVTQLHHLAPEDYAELRSNLHLWVYRAWKLTDPGPLEKGELFQLPVAAYDQRVTVATAAQVLGCTVRTIQRRVPAAARPGGLLVLRDALPPCVDCGQPYGQCDHSRCTRCDLIVGQCEHTTRNTVAQ